jgi:hypothetical protein
MSKDISVGTSHRLSEKKAGSNAAPITIVVRHKLYSGMGTYNSGLYLTAAEKVKADRRNPKDIAAEHADQIREAVKRVEQLAEVLNPFSFEVLKDLIKSLKNAKDDILIDLDYTFDAYQLASGYISPEFLLMPSAPADAQQQLLPVVAGQLQGTVHQLVPYQQHVIHPAINRQWSFNTGQQQDFSNGSQNGVKKFIPQGDANVDQWMNQLEDKIGTSDHTIFDKFDVTANLMEWMDFLSKKRDVIAYLHAKECVIRFCKAQGIETKRFGEEQKEEDYIPFFGIVKKFLEKMEVWMLKEGGLTKGGKIKPLKISTIRAYMSYIKATFEYCIGCRLLPEDIMPFGGVHDEDKYCLPEVDKRDITFEDEEFDGFLQIKAGKRDVTDGRKTKWKLGPYSEEEAKQILTFAYIAHGFNLRDFIKTEFSWFEITPGYFSFQRSKMKGRKNHKAPWIHVKVTSEHERIIATLGVDSLDPNLYEFPQGKPYIFPVLYKEEEQNNGGRNRKKDGEGKIRLIPITDKKEIEKTGRSFVAQVNRYLNDILKRLGIQKKTSYAFREQFVNDLIDTGKVDSKVAAQKVGHKGTGSIDFYMQKKNRKLDASAISDVTSKVTNAREAVEQKARKRNTRTVSQKKGVKAKTRPIVQKKKNRRAA